MSGIFEGYERQFSEIVTNLSRKTGNVALLSGEQKKAKVADLQGGLDEAESLIRRMDLEARTLPAAQKATLLAKLREYKTELNNLKREVKKSAAALPAESAARDDLLEAGLGTSLGSVSADQRSRLLASTDRLNLSSDRIKQGKRTLLETEELGVAILQDLHGQRQTLLHARDNLHGVDDNIGRSRQILNSMARRVMQNKIIMWGIILVLIFAIVLILYLKFRPTSSTST